MHVCQRSLHFVAPLGFFTLLWGLLVTVGCGSSPSSSPDASVDATADASVDTDGPMAAPPKIVINEVVLFPLNDWSDDGKDAAPGVAFDDTPGSDPAGSNDQYIEFYNAGDTTADMREWLIEMEDSASETMTIESEYQNLRISAGSTLNAVKPGAFVLIGNPDGTMATDVTITLKTAAGVVIDAIVVGDSGVLPGEANGFARGSFQEAVSRTTDGGNGFDKMYATPLKPNVALMAPAGDTEPPQLDSGPDITDYPATSLIRIPFTEQLNAADVKLSQVELKQSDGSDLGVEMVTFEDYDHTIVPVTVGRLPFGETVTVTLREIQDFAGNEITAEITTTITTEAAPANPATPVMINEICVDPQQDWGNQAGGDGRPFSSMPGNGNISSSDEWIELVVTGTEDVDMRKFALVVYNGPDPRRRNPPVSITVLEQNGTVRIFDTEGNAADQLNEDQIRLDAVPPGYFVVVGNPTESNNNDCYVALRDGDGKLLDEVEIGGNAITEDRGGDGANNGAPAPDADGEATGLGDETVARRPKTVDNEADTGVDVDDWFHSFATLGQANPEPPEPTQ